MANTKSILYNELQAFKCRPEMRIGVVSIERLDVYISGWLSHRYQCNDKDIWADKFADKFNGFVAKKYNESRSVGSSTIIAEKEADAGKQIALFLGILEEFCKIYPPD